jgi:hypothetical protein
MFSNGPTCKVSVLSHFHLKTEALQPPKCPPPPPPLSLSLSLSLFGFSSLKPEAVDSVQNFIHDSVVRAFFFWNEKVAEFAKKYNWP